MQKDCHYYGTYYIARKAGWTREQALSIAWAAQSVDEMTHGIVKDLRDEFNKALAKLPSFHIDATADGPNYELVEKTKDDEKKDKIILTETVFNTVTVQDIALYLGQKEFFSKYSLDQLSKQIESVWAPFHFLPSNTANQIKSLEKRNLDFGSMQKVSEQKYNRDLKMVCKPSSKLINQIFEYISDIVKHKSKSDLDSLYAIGIFMHVLADTWSHQDFCGSNDFLVNYGTVKDGDELIDMLQWHLAKVDMGKALLGGMGSNVLVTYDDWNSPFHCFSAVWTGHGTSGSYPDIPGKVYQYIPAYIDVDPKDVDPKEKESNRFTVNNPERFKKAFSQMFLILKALNEDSLFEITSNIEVPDFINEIESKCFKLGNETSRCELWKGFIHDQYRNEEELEEYDVKSNKQLNLIFFPIAHDYRNFVLDKIATEILNDKDYYKDVEQLTINELMESDYHDFLKSVAKGMEKKRLSDLAVNLLQKLMQNNESNENTVGKLVKNAANTVEKAANAAEKSKQKDKTKTNRDEAENIVNQTLSGIPDSMSNVAVESWAPKKLKATEKLMHQL